MDSRTGELYKVPGGCDSADRACGLHHLPNSLNKVLFAPQCVESKDALCWMCFCLHGDPCVVLSVAVTIADKTADSSQPVSSLPAPEDKEWKQQWSKEVLWRGEA